MGFSESGSLMVPLLCSKEGAGEGERDGGSWESTRITSIASCVVEQYCCSAAEALC